MPSPRDKMKSILSKNKYCWNLLRDSDVTVTINDFLGGGVLALEVKYPSPLYDDYMNSFVITGKPRGELDEHALIMSLLTKANAMLIAALSTTVIDAV